MVERAALTGGDAPTRGQTGALRTVFRSRRRGVWRASSPWFLGAVLLTAGFLWLLSLRRVNLRQIGDLGLLQVLPVLFWVALGVLAFGFCLALADRRTANGWLAAYVLGLIAFVHAPPSLLYPELRYAWAWKHVAIIDAMLQHNGAVPNAGDLSIYNQWPGFFELNVLFMRVTGIDSPLGYAAWTPVLLNVVLLGPLLLMYRSITRDRRLVWGGVWIFYTCSWVGQDYFAPQAFAFLLFVTVIAVVLRLLPSSTLPRPEADRAWPASWLIGVLVLVAGIVSSHQLTPLMLITALLALSVPRRNRRVTLPVLLAAVALTTTWNATVARPYLSENLSTFVRQMVEPEANITSGLSKLGTAAPGQVIVSWVDRGLSAAVLLLAVIAFACVPWVRRTGLPWLVISPFPLLTANAYGGEMIFRAYLFALPAAAFLVAALVFLRGRHPHVRMLVAFPLLLAMLGGLVFAYYGKEAMNYFTPKEVAAARFVTATAPPGSQIISLDSIVPGLDMHYDQHYRTPLDKQDPKDQRRVARNPRASVLAFAEQEARAPTYVILSRSSEAYIGLNGVFPADTMERLETALSRTQGFTVVYRNSDAVVYRYDPPLEGARR